MSASVGLAGNVKVMKTKYVGADYDLMSGPYMTVNVKLLASHVASGECACFVLVNNEEWDGENMTISKLSKLAKTMCVGEAELETVAASKILEIPMSISLDQQRLTGRDTVFYMKTVVVDFTKKDVIAQSDMISFNIDAQRTSEQMMESVGSTGLGLFMGLLSSDSEKDENYKWMNTEMHKRGRPKNKMAAEAKSNKSSNSQKMTVLMAFSTDCSASDIYRNEAGPMISTIIGPVAIYLVWPFSVSR